MNPPRSFSRRHFLATAAGAALANHVASTAVRGAATERFPIIGFTKPFQDLGPEATAEVVAKIGWSGIECPVRAKGQILPERVEEDLPKMHAALKARGLELSLITTDVRRVDPLTEKVLRTAQKLGVQRYRLTFLHYDLKQPIPPQLDQLRGELRELAALNKELGIRGGIQNHSGRDYVGAPIWDLYELLKDIDPQHLGVCFDIGHATVEGGTSWPIEAKLMEPFMTCVYVKDFAWEKGPKGWVTKWGPLGGGLVRREFFAWLKSSSYRGPISQHVEYLEGSGPEQISAMQRDVATLKEWLA